MNFIPVLMLALAILCICGFLGSGMLILFSFGEKYAARKRLRETLPGKKGGERRLYGADALLIGNLVLIGLAVTVHVATVFTGQSFSRCTVFFISIMGAALLFAAVLFLFYGFTHRKGKCREKATGTKKAKRADFADRILLVIFWALVAAQMAWLLFNGGVYTKGDMTVETVGSFLQTDGIYQVDPMTGYAYATGIPSRLKILCLPTLYGILCRLWGMSPESVVTMVAPIWVFVSSYVAFFCIGKCLFPENRKNRTCFLIIIVIIMWSGSGLYSMDGFNLLYCGYRGAAIRNLVLIPYLISLCLRKRWLTAVLCILAEACILWTFYGLGACLLVGAGLFLAERRRRGGGAS